MTEEPKQTVELTLGEMQQVVYSLYDILVQRVYTDNITRQELETVLTVVEGIVHRGKVCVGQLQAFLEYFYLAESFEEVRRLPYADSVDFESDKDTDPSNGN